MRYLSMTLLFLLASCGSQSGGGSGLGGGSRESVPSETTADLAGLNGTSVSGFIAGAIPALANEAGDRKELGTALDRKWRIRCETHCEIQRK